MLMGSISPGDAPLRLCASKQEQRPNNEHGNNGSTTAPPAPPQLDNDNDNDNNDNDNEGWGRVEQEKSAQTTRLASSGP